ncbi:class I SAM-dependent methyltransferase [Dyadobacter sandarakinus]|uniref:Class I SAM-dependent methyltransferase n=1 Tax=Dyadobacter sandarakinus TaxID=2747268 RepID=A0ABX7IC19_9BACT|nr:class I SAM-dependent methyltransferase [Dyadobacter sandarakinus]QRR03656.1 class I SAM-dependent methyltransferase [Dyadobacter sandarakinus]
MNNYDRIAGIYDQLAGLIFGRSQQQAQEALLPSLPVPCRLLIVGGGSGAVLESLQALYPAGLEVTYVESSSRMLGLARRRKAGGNRVQFVHAAIENWQAQQAYDAVMTPFLFDNFKDAQASAVFRHLDAMLRPGGLWLYTDFQIAKGRARIWQQPLLQCMYLFFRLIANVEARRMPDMQLRFEEGNYRPVYSTTRFSVFIFSAAFAKPY